jgi:hypothetical protein
MTARELALAARLAEAAASIDVEPDEAGVIDDHRRGITRVAVPWQPRGRSRPRVLLVAAVCVVVVAVGAIVVAQLPRSGRPASVSGAAPAVVVDGPAPGSFLPDVVVPPAWVGPLVPAERTSGFRTGRWVTTVFAITDGTTWRSPITASVFDGTFSELDAAVLEEIDGRAVRSVRSGGWQALATTGTPTVVVSGSVDRAVLAELLGRVQVIEDGAGFSLDVAGAPDSYSEVVPPHVLAEDVRDRRTLAGPSADVSINEVSDLVEPGIAGALSGATLTPVRIGDTTGWAGRSTGNPNGALRFLVWSPRRGVVFEIVTTDPSRSYDDLAELAAATQAVPRDEWTARHQR